MGDLQHGANLKKPGSGAKLKNGYRKSINSDRTIKVPQQDTFRNTEYIQSKGARKSSIFKNLEKLNEENYTSDPN